MGAQDDPGAPSPLGFEVNGWGPLNIPLPHLPKVISFLCVWTFDPKHTFRAFVGGASWTSGMPFHTSLHSGRACQQLQAQWAGSVFAYCKGPSIAAKLCLHSPSTNLSSWGLVPNRGLHSWVQRRVDVPDQSPPPLFLAGPRGWSGSCCPGAHPIPDCPCPLPSLVDMKNAPATGFDLLP